MGEPLGSRTIVESLVDRPHRCPSLFGQRGVGHIEERASPTRVAPRHPLRVDVDTVVTYRPVRQLLPLGHERDLTGRCAAHMVDEGDLVVRHGLEQIARIVEEECGDRRTREARAVQGVRHFGVEAGGGEEARIARATPMEEGAAFHSERAVDKPPHDNGRIDDKGRCRHGVKGLGSQLRAL